VDNALVIVHNICNTNHMNKNELIKKLLNDKRLELIWALSLQEYTHEDIAYIFRGLDRSSVTRIIQQRPEDYKPKWIKNG